MSKTHRRLIVIGLIVLALCTTMNWHLDNKKEQAARSHAANAWKLDFIHGYEASFDEHVRADEAAVLVKNAHLECVYLNEDPSLQGAWNYGTTALDMSSDQAAVVIEGAIKTHCQQHLPLLQVAEQ